MSGFTPAQNPAIGGFSQVKPGDPIKLPNSTPALTAKYVDVVARLQGFEQDLRALRTFLDNPIERSNAAARVAACCLSASVLEQAAIAMLITALTEKS